jgi:hypothetical protein
MYSGLDRRVHFSEEELAMGAIDLAEIEEEVANNTLVTAANHTMQAVVSVVKEAGPKIVEAIVNHLVPVVPTLPPSTVPPSSSQSAMSTQQSPVILTLPEVFASPPVETVVIFPTSVNISHPLVPVVHDTVILVFFVF